MSEWIKATSDNLPEFDYPVLGLMDGRSVQLVRRMKTDGKPCDYYWDIQLPLTFVRRYGDQHPRTYGLRKITHWAPLPDIPGAVREQVIL